MPLTLETRLRCNPDALVTELPAGDGESEAVLLNIATHKYFRLNASGLRIWTAIKQGQNLSAAVDDLVARFDVDEEHAGASVLRLADELYAAQLVTDVDASV
jgi:hypothetical protein